jgi:hypothetical protein
MQRVPLANPRRCSKLEHYSRSLVR